MQNRTPRVLTRAAMLVLAAGAVLVCARSALVLAEPPSDSPHARPAHETKPAPEAKQGKATTPPPPSSKSKNAANDHDAANEGAPASDRASAKPSEPSDHPSSDEALKLLQEGNERWIKAAVESPHNDAARRKTLADDGQKPFAMVLTCADSRIPVERLFDRGVGDVFVMRVAGNIAGPHEAGSIEYAAEHLHVPLLVVMGHTKCGAVGAAASHASVGGNVPSLVSAIEPAVARTKKLNPALDDKQLAAASVIENVWQTIFDLLKTSGPTRDMVSKGELRVVGAVYDIADGKVQWLGEHPWQTELVLAFSKDSAQAQVPEEKPEAK